MMAVVTTRAAGMREATPGDTGTIGNMRAPVYLVGMKGHFAVSGLGPANRTVIGTYLAMTINPATFQPMDVSLLKQGPPIALQRLGPPVYDLLNLQA